MYTGGTPPLGLLITQPLIKENTQSYKYLNYKSWYANRDVLAAETSFIEIQVYVCVYAYVYIYAYICIYVHIFKCINLGMQIDMFQLQKHHS
jgi:hypothetical protein